MPTIEEVTPVYNKFDGALFNFVKAPGADETTLQIVQNALKYLDDDQSFNLAGYGVGYNVEHEEQNLKAKLEPLVNFYRNIIPVLEQADNYLELTGLDGAPVLTVEVIEESLIPDLSGLLESLIIASEGNNFYDAATNDVEGYIGFGGTNQYLNISDISDHTVRDFVKSVAKDDGKLPDNFTSEYIPSLIDALLELTNLFEVQVSTKKQIDPPPETQQLGPVTIFDDVDLENSLGITSGYYIGMLLDPEKSNGKRTSPYLPIRTMPTLEKTPLKLGWSDLGYSLINNNGDLVEEKHAHTRPSSDGVEIRLGAGIEIREVVHGNTGVWVGFNFIDDLVIPANAITDLSPLEKLKKLTDNYKRVLYTKLEHVRKHSQETEKIPYTSQKVVLGRLPNDPPVEIKPGVKLINPGYNLNWTNLEPLDVRLAYFNFHEFNQNRLGDDLLFTTNAVNASPSLRFSEGYFYFIAAEGHRAKSKDLENELLENAPEDENPKEKDPEQFEKDLNAAKAEALKKATAIIKNDAYKKMLRYLGKDLSKEYPAVKNNFVVVDTLTRTGGVNPNNQKVLFAVPASYIDPLPSSQLPFHENFEPESEFRTGKNFIFTIRPNKVREKVNNLVKLLETIKPQLEKYASGSKNAKNYVRNPNDLKFEIDDEINSLKAFPDLLDDFMSRQAFPSSTNSDNISKYVAEGTNPENQNHILQFGLKDNNQVGGLSRETVAYMLFSPDPQALALEDPNTQFGMFEFDPYLTEDEIKGKVAMKRSAINLQVGLNWFRSRFETIQGSRTLHYLWAHDTMIAHKSKIDTSQKADKWVELLQQYSVPPLKIPLSRDSNVPPEEIDCEDLLEKLEKVGPKANTEAKILQEKVFSSPGCKKIWLEKWDKPTPASDPASSRQAIEEKSRNLDRASKKSGDRVAVKIMYTSILNNLDPQSLMTLLLACIEAKAGLPITKEALCEAAIEAVIESQGVENIKALIIENIPSLAPFLAAPSDLMSSKAAAIIEDLESDSVTGTGGLSLGVDGKLSTSPEWSFPVPLYLVEKDPFATEIEPLPSLEGETLLITDDGQEYRFEATNTFVFQENQGAAKVAPEGWRYVTKDGENKIKVAEIQVRLSPDFASAPKALAYALSGGDPIVANTLKNLEKGGVTIELIPGKRPPGHQAEVTIPNGTPGAVFLSKAPNISTEYYSWDEIADTREDLLESGYSYEEAESILIQEGMLVAAPRQYKSITDAFLDPLDRLATDLGDSSVSVYGVQTSGAALQSGVQSARDFLNYLKRIVDIQKMCEAIVGPLLELPGALLSGNDIAGSWDNWSDDFIERMKRHFGPPSPRIRFPFNLKTDSLVGDYSKLLKQAFVAMIGSMLGQILNVLLESVLRQCFEEDNPAGPIGPLGQAPGSVPIPSIGPVPPRLRRPGLPQADMAAWMKDILDNLTPGQTCSLLRGVATEATLKACQIRTRQDWPLVYNSGIKTYLDIKSFFVDIGENINLDICDTIQLAAPVVVDVCTAGFDYDTRCANLREAGLSNEECEEQIKKELEDMRNRILALADFLFPDKNPLKDSMPEMCSPEGFFQLPDAFRNTMSEITENVLVSIRGSLIRDLLSLKFFSLPPRALLAATDKEELNKAHKLFTDAAANPYEKSCLAYVGDAATHPQFYFPNYCLTFNGRIHYGGLQAVEALDAGLTVDLPGLEFSGIEFLKDPEYEHFKLATTPMVVPVTKMSNYQTFFGNQDGNSTIGVLPLHTENHPSNDYLLEESLPLPITVHGFFVDPGAEAWLRGNHPKKYKAVVRQVAKQLKNADESGFELSTSEQKILSLYKGEKDNFESAVDLESFSELTNKVAAWIRDFNIDGALTTSPFLDAKESELVPVGLEDFVYESRMLFTSIGRTASTTNTHVGANTIFVDNPTTELKHLSSGIPWGPTSYDAGKARRTLALNHYSLDTKLRDIDRGTDGKGDVWIHLLRSFTGYDFSSTDKIGYAPSVYDSSVKVYRLAENSANAGGMKAADFEEDGSLGIHSPGYKYLMERARDLVGEFAAIRLVNVFSHLTVGEALGLTDERIKKLYPNFPGASFIDGVIFSFGAPADQMLSRGERTTVGDVVYNDFTVAKRQNDQSGYMPLMISYKQNFRDPDSLLNKPPEEVMAHFSMDNAYVNAELYEELRKMFNLKSSDRTRVNFESNSNFNPNRLIYDIPFTDVVAKGTGLKQIDEVAKVFQGLNTADSEITSLVENIEAVKSQDKLIYQNVATPLEANTNKQISSIMDQFKVAKGRLPRGLGGYNVVVDDRQIAKEKFNINHSKAVPQDVQNLLDEIGMGSWSKVSEEFEKMSFLLEESGLSNLTPPAVTKNIDSNPLNFKSQIFARLMTYKFQKYYEQYVGEAGFFEAFGLGIVHAQLWKSLSTYGYSALQFAYSSQMFEKLRNSRLHSRKFLRKLWSKILKSELNEDMDPRCKKVFDELSVIPNDSLQKAETDFFDLSSVKQDILDFYEKSVCRDVYDGNSEGENSVKNALVEGCVILLVKIYTLEVCLASVIAWDSFDLSDIFDDDLVSKVIINNMRKELAEQIGGLDGGTDWLSHFANKIVNKQNNYKGIQSLTALKAESSLQALVKQEGKNIARIVRSLFKNSKTLSSKLEFNVLKNSDPDFIEDHAKILGSVWYDKNFAYKLAMLHSSGNIDYVLDARLPDNIYTLNYGAPQRAKISNTNLDDAFTRTKLSCDMYGFNPQKTIRDNGVVHEETQKDFLYSMPANVYYEKNPGDLGDSPEEGIDRSNTFTFEDKFREWYKKTPYRLYQTEAGSNLEGGAALGGRTVSDHRYGRADAAANTLHAGKLFENSYETVVGNFLNAKLGNVTIQPYVRIVDATAEDRKGKTLKKYIDVDAQGLPCDPTEVDFETSAEELLGDGPFLEKYRRNEGQQHRDSSHLGAVGDQAEGNAYNAHIFGYVPLEIWSHFYNNVFLDWINNHKTDNKLKLKALFETYGLGVFFREVSFGLRLSYSTAYPVFDAPDQYYTDLMSNITNPDGVKECKSLINTRLYSLYVGDRGQIGNGLIGEFNYTAETGVKGPSNQSMEEKEDRWALLNEFQVPIAEVEQSLGLFETGFSYNGETVLPYEDLGTYVPFLPFQGNSLPDILQIGDDGLGRISVHKALQNKEELQAALRTPYQFFYKNLAQDLLARLQRTPEFKLMYEYLFPMKRYMATAFLYAGEGISKFIPETTDVLDDTKNATILALHSVMQSDDYTFVPDPLANQLEEILVDSQIGTRGQEPNLTKELLKIVIRTPLLILKGFVEVTDPAIMIAKTIIDVANAIQQGVIGAIETALRQAKATLDTAISKANSARIQVEVQAGLAGSMLEMAASNLPSSPDLNSLANIDTSDSQLKNWTLELDPLSALSAEDAELMDEEIEKTYNTFKEQVDSLKTTRNEYVELTKNIDELEKEKEDLVKDLEQKVKKAKEKANSAFSSPYMLPAIWAALFPSIMPYGAGLNPFGGTPPSTFPGIIYLALLFMDAYEEKLHDQSTKSNSEPNCEDEL